MLCYIEEIEEHEIETDEIIDVDELLHLLLPHLLQMTLEGEDNIPSDF